MKIKKTSMLIECAFLAFVAVACKSSEATEVKDIHVKGELDLLENVELDYENAVLDNFSEGIDPNRWLIGDQAWGKGNGGVIPENVSYTEDGILMLRGNGGYYQEGEVQGVGDVKDGRYTGAALISNFVVGPGRYEIKMKALPRLGACTAFWTYAYENEQKLNHEIDIELPGGIHKGLVSFSNLLNTNYIKENRSTSQDTKIGEIFDKEMYLNDGSWHTYGFDWYTNPEKIIYYMDGKICAISDTFVPTMQQRLWCGVWFPINSFVGTAEFESDYMAVDYISYIPFKDQPYVEYTPFLNATANPNEYPQAPKNPKRINKVANGSFEFINEKNLKNSGWKLEKYLNEDKPVDDVCYIQQNMGKDGTKGLVIRDGGVAEQRIDAVYHGFKHKLSLMAKGEGTLRVHYYSTNTMQALKTIELPLKSDGFKKFSLDLEAPEDSQCLIIELDSYNGKMLQIDNVDLVMI